MSKKLPPDKQAVLDAERAINEQYRRRMEQLIKDEPSILKSISVVQSARWTGTAPKGSLPKGPLSPIVGRVVLEADHPDRNLLLDNLYIVGFRPGDPDELGVEFINWAAPIAALFFEGRASNDALASFVHARRSFVACRDDIVDFDDDVESDVVDDPFTRGAADLEIAMPPSIVSTEPDVVATEEQFTDEVVEELHVEPEVACLDESEPERPVEPDSAPHERLAALGLELRAEEALFTVMMQPKEGHMGTILPTLQVDQYGLLSWPASKPLIVQGQPGTGKTVIATYRALYLTSDQRGDDRVARVGIVGPSDQYVEHLHPVLSGLQEQDADIRLVSLSGLFEKIVELPNSPRPAAVGRIESSWQLPGTIERFVAGLASRPNAKRMDQRVRAAVDLARKADHRLIPDAVHRKFFASLPSWDDLRSGSQYLPMLVAFALALGARVPGGPVAHVIVDEAQDVRPIEWRILLHTVLEPGGGVSLFGDMNQRRSDHTHSDWKDLAVDLELTDDEGAVEIRELEIGYRSTKQIINFANQLLPWGVRGEKALRDGPSPTIRKTDTEAQRRTECFTRVVALSEAYEGYVAWITYDVSRADRMFRERQWARPRHPHMWVRNDRTVVVLHPDHARGIEFDAVVVEEPADFDQNLGRDGVLYTSLTRANKELVVVHSKPLPRNLRPRN